MTLSPFFIKWGEIASNAKIYGHFWKFVEFPPEGRNHIIRSKNVILLHIIRPKNVRTIVYEQFNTYLCR